MLNYLWGFMLLIAIVYGAITGNLTLLTDAALNSAKEAVALCITIAGVMSFWMGLMKIAEHAGLIASAAKKLMPFLGFLFPKLPKSHKANEYIAANMIANIFGLGWAATPAGLNAMEALSELEKERPTQPVGVASNEMCTFLIINISSLQLIPVNIIAYRGQYGSANPVSIVAPAILATIISTMAGILFCKFANRRNSL